MSAQAGEGSTTTLPFGKAATTVIAAVWTLVSGGLGAIFASEIKDRWFPPKESVALQRVSFEPNVTFGQYLDRTGAHAVRVRFPAPQLERRGMVIFVGLDTTGFKGDGLQVRGTVLRADTCEEQHELARLHRGFAVKPAANEESLVANLWIAQPPSPGVYLARVRVYGADAHSRIKAARDSGALRVSSDGRVQGTAASGSC
jgi:hypothetical protein